MYPKQESTVRDRPPKCFPLLHSWHTARSLNMFITKPPKPHAAAHKYRHSNRQHWERGFLRNPAIRGHKFHADWRFQPKHRGAEHHNALQHPPAPLHISSQLQPSPTLQKLIHQRVVHTGSDVCDCSSSSCAAFGMSKEQSPQHPAAAHPWDNVPQLPGWDCRDTSDHCQQGALSTLCVSRPGFLLYLASPASIKMRFLAYL